MKRTTPNQLIAYVVAAAATAAAFSVRFLLDPLLGDHLPFVTFFVAVVVAAWVGGLRPALVATVLGFVLALYFFVPPRHSFVGPSGPHLVGLAMYFMVSLAIAGFGEAMRVAQRRFKELARQYEQVAPPTPASVAALRQKHSLRDVAVIGFVLTVAVLAADGVLGYVNAGRLAHNNERVDHTHRVIGALESLLSTLKDAETGQRGYLLTEDEKYLQPYDDVVGQVHDELARIKELTSDNPDQQTRLSALAQQIARKLDELKRTVALMKAGDRPAALQIVRGDTGRQLMDEVLKSVAAMQREEHELLERRAAESEASHGALVWSIVLSAVVGLVLVSVVFVLSQRNVRARQRAAFVIAEQGERLRTTLASIGDAVITTDTEGRITNMNAVAEALTGWTNAGAVGQPLDAVFRIVNEQTRQPVENPAFRALKEGVIIGLANHTLLVARDGSERPIDDSAAPIRCKEGEVVGCVLVFRDVTRQRRAARRLAESEARKTAILNSALDCIITIDHEGRVVEFNPAAERTFGYRRADVIGREMGDLIVPPVLREGHRGGMARYLATGEGPVLNRRLELTALRTDGTEFPVEVAITPIAGAGHPLFTGHLRDITDRKQGEAAAAERLRHATLDAEIGFALSGNDPLREMLQACAESLVRNLDGAFGRIWTLNKPLAVLELQASAGMYTHLDGPHGRVPVGQLKIGLIAQERKPHLTNAVLGDPRVPEQEWARREGLVAFAGYPLVVNERLVGVVALFARQPLSETTLTAMASAARGIALGIERKEMEERLRQYVADLSEADRRKDEFLATLAHELRNPLAPIRNGLQLMRLASGQPATIEQARSMMERQLTQLVRLVDDLMDVSRITRGKLELRKEPVPLAAVVNSAVETSRPLIEEMGHELTVVLPKRSVLIEADLTRMAQVFMNLLNNAAKYTDRGGRIWLIAEQHGSGVAVSVKDNGIGIDADQLPRIFGLFSQVDRSLEKAQGGLGIGLTLVKRLVEMHGGSVEAASAGRNKGSEFVVRLPVLVEASRPRAADEEDRAPAVKSSLRILIVDDNRDGADSLATMLGLMGHDTRTAYDGQAGVDAAVEVQPDVILLDIGLPKLNGYEACRRIREQPWGQKSVLIAVTGWGQDEDRRRSREVGFDHHIVKPVDPEALLKLLAGLSHDAKT